MAERDQLGPDAWLDAALDALRTEGLKGVAVEPLARRLGVTKGSFYWHFANRDALLKAAVERWELTQTDALISWASTVSDPRERLAQLITRVGRSQRGLRLSRALAGQQQDPIIGPAVRRVSERRLLYLSACLAELGLPASAAKHAGRFLYASYLGLAELDALGLGPRSQAEQHDYFEQLIVMFVPQPSTPASKGRPARKQT